MEPWNLKAATREANAKFLRKEQEARTRQFIEESTGTAPTTTPWGWIVGFILLLCMIGYALIRSATTIAPSLGTMFSRTATPFVYGAPSATPIIVTPTPGSFPTQVAPTMISDPSPEVSATPMPTDVTGIRSMPFGGVNPPYQIPNDLDVPDFNGTLSGSPQKILCGNGKTNVSFDYQPGGVWTKVYVLTAARPSAIFVKMPSELGGTVTIYCPPAVTTILYIYVQ